MSAEWGPWIEHDGRSAPIGYFVRAEIVGVGTHEGRVDQTALTPSPPYESRWIYDAPRMGKVIRYRIRKPRGLTILEEALRDLPVEVDA